MKGTIEWNDLTFPWQVMVVRITDEENLMKGSDESIDQLITKSRSCSSIKDPDLEVPTSFNEGLTLCIIMALYLSLYIYHEEPSPELLDLDPKIRNWWESGERYKNNYNPWTKLIVTIQSIVCQCLTHFIIHLVIENNMNEGLACQY